MMRTLFLNPPSYAGFDGGAGARYQAKREIRSYWYPTWLAQPAAIVPGSQLVDAPPAGLTLADVVPLARATTTWRCCTPARPRSPGDVKVAEALKAANPALLVGFVGAKVAVQPEAVAGGLGGHRLRGPGGVRLHRSPRWPRAARWPRSTASATGTRTGRWCTTPTGRSWRTWTGCRS